MSNFYNLVQSQIKCLNAKISGNQEEFEKLSKNLPIVKLSEEQRKSLIEMDKVQKREDINFFNNIVNNM